MRVEIIVDYPANLDINALTVVDPKNPNQPGFHFVSFEVDKSANPNSTNQKSSSSKNKSNIEMRTAVAVPTFCVQDGEKNCYYSIQHSTLGWNHGVIPRQHKIENNNENNGMIKYRVKLTTDVVVLDGDQYIQCKLRNNFTISFFVSLEAVVPSVPESALRGAFDIIQRSNNDKLLKFALRYKDTTIARYSLNFIYSKGIYISAIASKFKDLNITPDDQRFNAAIAALVLLKGGIKRRQTQIQIKQQEKFKQPLIIERHSNGFLCDKKKLFKENNEPNKILLDAAQQLNDISENKFNLTNIEELLRIGKIYERFPRFIATDNAKQRLDIVSYALRSGVPLLIQGPTSASKSLTAQVASFGLYGQLPLIYALSQQTEIGDLLGRKILQRKGISILSYVTGVLAEAYEKGRVLLLDEFDLCPPKVISSILSALDGSTIEIEGRQIVRHQNFRVIGTLNGETEGFTSQQRNILTSEVLARFNSISFPAMERNECNDIFNQLLQKSNPLFKRKSKQIADVHQRVANYYAITETTDKSRGSVAMTLRNFNSALDLMVFDKLKLRDAYQIAYLAQIPTADRVQFNRYIDALGKSDNFNQLRNEITMVATEMHIHPHPQFIDAAVYAIVAARNGLHILLEGPSGCGLTTLARFVYDFCTKETARERRIVVPEVLLGPESTIENIIGQFKPQDINVYETDMTKLIKWENGPLLIAAESGTPVILDRIDEAKAQVIERLNPILEKNSRRDKAPFLVPEKGGCTEQQVEQGFVVVATLTTNPNRQEQAISLALRNRFVTIAVDPPELSDQLRTLIAQTDISKVAEKMKLIN
ncbi:MAG: hypothetical protein EZS28_008170, partial [Streblomastix strix]